MAIEFAEGEPQTADYHAHSIQGSSVREVQREVQREAQHGLLRKTNEREILIISKKAGVTCPQNRHFAYKI